jgi:hypothetical protein
VLIELCRSVLLHVVVYGLQLSVAQPAHQVMSVHQSLVENSEQCCNLHYSLRNTTSYASCSIDLKAQSAVQYSNIASYNR